MSLHLFVSLTFGLHFLSVRDTFAFCPISWKQIVMRQFVTLKQDLTFIPNARLCKCEEPVKDGHFVKRLIWLMCWHTPIHIQLSFTCGTPFAFKASCKDVLDIIFAFSSCQIGWQWSMWNFFTFKQCHCPSIWCFAQVQKMNTSTLAFCFPLSFEFQIPCFYHPT